METQYQVWLRARHPRTLEIVAEVRVLNLADRLHAERAVETAQSLCQPLVLEILRVHPGALVSVEMHMADALVLRSRHTVTALSDRPSMHNLPRAAAAPAESADDYMRRAARDGVIVQRRNRLGQDVYEYQYGADRLLQHFSETNKQKALTDLLEAFESMVRSEFEGTSMLDAQLAPAQAFRDAMGWKA